MKIDFIIIGQGIAGTCFAFELIRRNKSFVIIDKYDSTSSSQIALGVYNPLVLKWFTKVWNVDNQLHDFNIFYNDLKSISTDTFAYDNGIYKFLHNPYDQNNWLSKSSNRNTSLYMSSDLKSINNPGLVFNKFFGLVNFSGRVDVQLLLNSFRSYCKSVNKLINEQFDYKSLTVNNNLISYKKIKADKIIFCEGYKAVDNPFFSKIKFKPTKGELLVIYSKNLDLDKIIHSKFLFIPLGNDYYSVGATYNWNDITNETTLNGRQQLVNMLDSFLQVPYKIIHHKAGIRPSIFDRRPVVGSHSEHKNMYILNGLGTRGVLLAPYLSNVLCNYIYNNTLINLEIDYSRM